MSLHGALLSPNITIPLFLFSHSNKIKSLSSPVFKIYGVLAHLFNGPIRPQHVRLQNNSLVLWAESAQITKLHSGNDLTRLASDVWFTFPTNKWKQISSKAQHYILDGDLQAPAPRVYICSAGFWTGLYHEYHPSFCKTTHKHYSHCSRNKRIINESQHI